jgi:hypothetical protein
MGGINVTPLIETTHPFGASALDCGVLLVVCRAGRISIGEIADQLYEFYEIWFSERDIRLTVRALAEGAYVSEDLDQILPTSTGKDALEVYLRAFIRMIDGGRNIFAIGVVAKLAAIDFDKR